MLQGLVGVTVTEAYSNWEFHTGYYTRHLECISPGENFKEFFRLPTGQPESHSRLPHMNSSCPS